jgi:catechol 2,3-dioxygenase-like lactoylglutathione lyase family enzyme
MGSDLMTGHLSRRSFLLSVPILAAASRLLAQDRPTLTLRALNHIAIAVSDKVRSMEFYQGLFGWPINHTQGGTQGLNTGFSVGATGIRIGAGPQYITMSQGSTPGWGHFCVTVEGFDVDRITQVLDRHGVSRTPTSESGPMRAWVRLRGPENGGAPEGTPEFYVNDPDGVRFQLQDPSYCGGPGVLGDGCPSAPPLDGVLVVRDFQSFALSASNQGRSRDFYQALFGTTVMGRQGAAEMLRVGSGRQRLLIDGGAGTGATPRITHVCLVMDGFDAGEVQQALSQFGVQPRSDATGVPGPMASWVRMGGAEGDTPELFFTDPDGIVLQLQDASYCGGAGRLGDVCA